MLNTWLNKQKKSGDSLTPIVSIITDEGSAETKHLNHFVIATTILKLFYCHLATY